MEELISRTDLVESLYTSLPLSIRNTTLLNNSWKETESLSQHIISLRQDLDGLRYKANHELQLLKQKECDWKETEQNMNRVLKPFTTGSLQQQLIIALRESETLSEALMESFLEGSSEDGVDVMEFTRNYRELRKTLHLRKQKTDNWIE